MQFYVEILKEIATLASVIEITEQKNPTGLPVVIDRIER